MLERFLTLSRQVDQILGHVVNSIEQMVNVIPSRENGGGDDLKKIIGVERLLENIKVTYLTTEERLNRKVRDSHELPSNEPNEPSELIFFLMIQEN